MYDKFEEGLAIYSRDVLCFTVGAGDAVPLGCAGASLAVSHQQLRCCCGNTNKICCFGLTQFRVINNNKNSYLPCMTPYYSLQKHKNPGA